MSEAKLTERSEMNILKNNFICQLIKSRPFIFLVRLPFVAAFMLIVYAGFSGSIYRNGATLAVMFWLVFISLLAIMGGKIWCLICPWNIITEWLQKILLPADNKLLNFKVPKLFRNLWLPVFLFLLIIWLEYAAAMTDNARMVAYLALIIFGSTFVSALIFTRKSFCRYACPVGAICGIYGLFAPLELRSSDKETCKKCQSKDCVKGNEKGAPCPVFEYPGIMDDSFYCILCTECIHTCPNDNITVNIRAPAFDLAKFRILSFSEFFIIISMLALSVFGAINISIFHLQIIDWASTNLLLPGMVSLLFLMLLLIAAVFLIIYAIARVYNVSASMIVYVMLPIALFNHMANTVKLFSIRAEEAVSLISDPLGFSWNLFGTSGYLPKTLFAPATLMIITVPLMLFGLLFSMYLAYRMRNQSRVSVIMLLIPMGFLVWFNWWLMPQ